MTPRQDGGFFAGLKMSHLVTSQDFGSQDFLRAVCEPISQSTIAREPQDFFTVEQAAATRRMEV